MMKYGLTVCLLCLLAACGSRSGSGQAADGAAHDSAVQVQFPLPDIPGVLVEPADRQAYLLAHYWDRFDFADTALVNNRNVAEQGFVNFMVQLMQGGVSDAQVRESLLNWCKAFVSEPHARKAMMKLADSYLYNPNSPYYNEPLYGAYVQAMLQALPADDAQRSALDFKRKLLERNNVGTRATDFTYYLPDGRRGSLYGTVAKGGWLVLVFYDPECGSCHKALQQMAADPALAAAVNEGRLSVLAVYTEGNDKAWRKGLAEMPEGWTVAADREQVKEQALYDLKALPSIYLLDGAKNVVLKDVGVEALCSALGL